MKAHTASAINAFSLIALGGWGYFATNSPTALIPVAFGVLLLVMNNGIRHENKIMSHIAVFLTLLILVALVRPFMSNLNEGDTLGIVRTGLMLLTSALAMIYFIKSFIDARKKST